MMMFEHFVITRFNVRLPWANIPARDEAWLEHRFLLFERFCLPSVEMQREQTFRWLVFFDKYTPEKFRHKIETYGNRLASFYPVFVESFDIPVVKVIIEKLLTQKTEYVLTSRLDSDDAIARDYTHLVQEVARSERETQAFITFSRGYSHRGRGIYYAEYVPNSFFSLLENRREISTGYSYDHNKILRQGLVRIISNYSGWMQVIHDRNQWNRPSRFPRPVRRNALISEFPESCIDVSDSFIRWSTENLLHYARRYGGPIKRSMKKSLLSVNKDG